MTRFLTRVFDRFFSPRMPEPYAGPTRPWLLWLVFTAVVVVFPGLEILSALIGLADVIAGRSFDPLGDPSLVDVTLTILAGGLLPVTMVWLLLRLTGDRMVRLGLLTRPAGETIVATWWTFAWIFALGGVLEFGLSLLISLAPAAQRYTAQIDIGTGISFAQLAVVAVPAAICAGLAEEIVVLGFAYRMLERAGLSDRSILALLVALRLSYHLYYGVGALVLLPWAFLSVVYYRRYRQLWPLILGHTGWDIFAILTSGSPRAQAFGLVVTGLIVLAAAVVAVVRWRRVRRGPLLTLEIPRPRPQWSVPPASYPPRTPQLPTAV
ncbi:MAG: CPBP family intramembrane glutamic endopeptidase [Pseudonocardiales bacterium]